MAMYLLQQSLTKGPSLLRRKYAGMVFKMLLDYVRKEYPDPGPFASEAVRSQATAELRRRCDIVSVVALVLQRCSLEHVRDKSFGWFNSPNPSVVLT
jgi:hypothetical protein